VTSVGSTRGAKIVALMEQICVRKAVSDMAIKKEQAIDILDKFDFFQGQRAGRELWNDKPFDTQEEDIKVFSRDVAELKAYIADVVPKSEVVKALNEVELLIIITKEAYKQQVEDATNELSKQSKRTKWIAFEKFYEQFAELKKKYTEDQNDG
jgi:hypothetical protein